MASSVARYRSVNGVGVRTETRCDACGRKIYESYPYTGSSTGTSFALPMRSDA